MTEVLKGAVGGAWSWLIAYVFPAALFLGAVGTAARLEAPNPQIVDVWIGWTSDNQLLIAGAASVAVAVLLLALNGLVLRALEGYVLVPQIRKLWEWMCDRHRRRKRKIEAELASAVSVGGTLRQAFLIEKLMRYPSEDSQIGPTRFANAIRSFETYGAATFGLDSQTLWDELYASAPEEVRAAEGSARAQVDLLANMIALSSTLVLVSAARLIFDMSSDRDIDQAVWIYSLGLGLILIPFWYALAIQAVHQWAGAGRAVVNLGRKPLADALDLRLPLTVRDETDMWREVVWLVRQGPDANDPLRKYRKPRSDRG